MPGRNKFKILASSCLLVALLLGLSAPEARAAKPSPVELKNKTYEVLQSYRSARNQLIQNKKNAKSIALYRNKLAILNNKIKYLESEYARQSKTAAAYERQTTAAKKTARKTTKIQAAAIPKKAAAKKATAQKTKSAPKPAAKRQPAAKKAQAVSKTHQKSAAQKPPAKKSALKKQASAAPVAASARTARPIAVTPPPTRPVARQFALETTPLARPTPHASRPAKTPARKPAAPSAGDRIQQWWSSMQRQTSDTTRLWVKGAQETYRNGQSTAQAWSSAAASGAQSVADAIGAGARQTSGFWNHKKADLSAGVQRTTAAWRQWQADLHKKTTAVSATLPKSEAPVEPKPALAKAVLAPMAALPLQPTPKALREEPILLPEPENPTVESLPTPQPETPLEIEASSDAMESDALQIEQPLQPELEQEVEQAAEPEERPAAKKALLGSGWLEMDETYKTLHLLSLMGRLVNHDIIAWKSQSFYAGEIDKALAKDPSLRDKPLNDIFLDLLAHHEPDTREAIKSLR